MRLKSFLKLSDIHLSNGTIIFKFIEIRRPKMSTPNPKRKQRHGVTGQRNFGWIEAIPIPIRNQLGKVVLGNREVSWS